MADDPTESIPRSPGNMPGKGGSLQLSRRQSLNLRLKSLQAERQSWVGTWLDIDRYILPGRTRITYGKNYDRNRGDRKDSNIINNTAGRAVRILGAGMTAGLSSPARPWYELATRDPDLNNYKPVALWLRAVADRIRQLFLAGNLYKALQQLYQELGGFCTSTLFTEEDATYGMRAYVVPIGSYHLANGPIQRVDTFYREYSITVANLVKKFGEERLSLATSALLRARKFDEWVPVVHAIEPNDARVRSAIGPKGMAFSSVWYEPTASDNEPLLRESGFPEFPCMGVRWGTTGEDVYGRGPGWDCLGDVKALQSYEKRKAQLVEKLVNPPMVAPTSLQRQRSSMLPGETTYLDMLNANATFRPAHEIQPAALPAVTEIIQEHERRIDAAFYADLWLMLSQNTDGDITAREVVERHEEKMLQLGPVLEQVEDELLSPVIERAFGILQRRGMLPPAPKELLGQDLRVNYISILAQAQKLLGYASLQQFTGYVLQLGQVRTDAFDVVNIDALVRETGDVLGIKPDILRSDEEVAGIRQARAQAAQAQAKAQQLAQTAMAAKNLASAPTGGDQPNALTDLLGAVSPLAQKPNAAGT